LKSGLLSGNYNESVTVSSLALTSKTVALTGTVIDLPSVSIQPTNTSVCVNSNTSFTSSSASVPATTIQWQRSFDGTSWTNVTTNLDAGVTYSGFTSNTLVLNNVNLSLNNYQYRAVFTNANGTVNSSSATLTVLD
jgi:hypothetical protein